jgi:hypothetical protein
VKPGAGEDDRLLITLVEHVGRVLPHPAREGLGIGLVHPAEAAKLALDRIEVTVVIAVFLHEQRVGDLFARLDAAQAMDREG